MTNNPTQGHPAHGAYFDTETGDYVMPGGATLSPNGIYTDPYGERRHGNRRMRIRPDGALAPAVPAQDAADPRPLPPLVPTGPGWPAPPEGFGWPHLDNPNHD